MWNIRQRSEIWECIGQIEREVFLRIPPSHPPHSWTCWERPGGTSISWLLDIITTVDQVFHDHCPATIICLRWRERERGHQMVSGGGDDDEDEKWIISWELPAVAWLAPNRWWILTNLFWSIYGRTDKSRDNVIAEALQLCQKFFTDIWSIFQEQTGEGHWGNVLRDFK